MPKLINLNTQELGQLDDGAKSVTWTLAVGVYEGLLGKGSRRPQIPEPKNDKPTGSR